MDRPDGDGRRASAQMLVDLYDADGKKYGAKTRVTLEWSIKDPFCVRLNFGEGEGAISWQMCRYTLTDVAVLGTGQHYGDGDIQMHNRGEYIDIKLFGRDPDIDESLLSVTAKFPSYDLLMYVIQIKTRAVKYQEEILAVVDDEIARLLQGA